jgi:hypothetical protein
MQRSLIKRSETITNLKENYYLSKPDIHQSSLIFEHSKCNQMNFECDVEAQSNNLEKDDDLRGSHSCIINYFNLNRCQTIYFIIKYF